MRRTSLEFACAWLALLSLGGLFGSAGASAEQPTVANETAFHVPLADGHTGSAIMLPAGDDQTMVVAAAGSPPVLAIYRVSGQDSPQPEPEPEPGPEPEPEPDPQPDPQGPLRLIWIEETADRTPEQAEAITDTAIRDALREAGWSLRVADVDVVDERGRVPVELEPYIAAARRDGLPRLFAVNAHGAEVFAGKAPDDIAAFQAILQQLGLPQQSLPVAPVPDSDLPQDPDDEPEPEPVGAADTCPDGNCPVHSLPQPRVRFRLFR